MRALAVFAFVLGACEAKVLTAMFDSDGVTGYVQFLQPTVSSVRHAPCGGHAQAVFAP